MVACLRTALYARINFKLNLIYFLFGIPLTQESGMWREREKKRHFVCDENMNNMSIIIPLKPLYSILAFIILVFSFFISTISLIFTHDR